LTIFAAIRRASSRKVLEIIYRPFNRFRVVRSPKSEGESVLPLRLLMGLPAGARVSAYEFPSVPQAGLRPSLSGSVGALPIVKSIFDFTHVLRPTRKRIRALSIWFIVLEFTNKFLSVGPREIHVRESMFRCLVRFFFRHLLRRRICLRQQMHKSPDHFLCYLSIRRHICLD
jgi:hypothetical protein